MINLLKIVAVVILASAPHAASAQGIGQLQAGQIWGNPTAAAKPATGTTVGAILDQSYSCNARGDIIFRGASAWSCLAPGTAGKPLLSGGAGADIAYGTLTVGGGGTGLATLTAHSLQVGNGTSNVTQIAVGGANFPLIGQASADPTWSTITYPTSATSGGVACFTSTTAMASSVLQTANAIMLGAGAGACPTPLGSLGTTTTLLHGNAGGAPTFGSVAYADIATAALATSANLEAGAASTLLSASIIYDGEVTITYAASQTLDFNTFLNGRITLTGNITSLTCSNIKASQSGVISLVQDGTGSRTMVAGWCSQFRWAAGARGVLSTTASAIDALFYQCPTTSICYVSLAKAQAN